MTAPPENRFLEAVRLAVQRNADYVPPVGTGATLYIRPLLLEEIKDFAEIGACGTAAVITPISSITRGKEVLRFGDDDKKPGPTLERLYNAIQAIQFGKSNDQHRWMMPV